MSVSEQLPIINRNEHADSMEDAITRSGVQSVLESGEYRPDKAAYERMHRIQVELASASVTTVLSSVYQRGRSEPISYMIRRPLAHENIAPVISIDNYR